MLSNTKTKLYLLKKKIKKIPKPFQNNFWETNIDNLYYGHYHILKQYTKTILPYKINGEVQHGWSYGHGIAANPFLHNKEEKLKRYYVINKYNKKKSIKYGYKNVEAIGAPFLYLPKNLYINNNYKPKTLILFPVHTSEHDGFHDTIDIHKRYIEDLKKILPLFKSITVSLGWREYENKTIVNLFKHQGISVVTMGYRDNNPNFLFNFIKCINKHEYVSSESFSSAIFYSLIMRKKVFIYGRSLLINAKNDPTLNEQYPYKFYSSLYPQLLWENYNDKSHYNIAEIELGLEFKRSPNELRKIFGWHLKNIFI